MTTTTTPRGVPESELFRQFLDGEIISHTFSGKIDRSTPVRNFVGGNENPHLDDFVEGVALDAQRPEAQSLDVLEAEIYNLESALRDLNVLRAEFIKARAEQEINLPDDAPDDAEQLYRPLAGDEATEEEIHADTLTEEGAGFIAMTKEDERHIRGE